MQEYVSAVSQGSLQDIRNSGASVSRVPASDSACEIPRSVRASSVCATVRVADRACTTGSERKAGARAPDKGASIEKKNT